MTGPKNILIVRTDRIGDVVLSLPLAGFIKKHYPDCKVSFLIRNYTKELTDDHPYIDEVLILQEKNGNIPVSSNVNQLKEKYSFFEKILDDTLYTFKSQQKEYSSLRPLQFKEELLKNQKKLETMTGGFDFPRGIGMVDYLDTKVPRDEELQELTKEMYVLYEIMRILYKNNVDKITDIERFEKEN